MIYFCSTEGAYKVEIYPWAEQPLKRYLPLISVVYKDKRYVTTESDVRDKPPTASERFCAREQLTERGARKGLGSRTITILYTVLRHMR